jgi:hypothetical protein
MKFTSLKLALAMRGHVLVLPFVSAVCLVLCACDARRVATQPSAEVVNSVAVTKFTVDDINSGKVLIVGQLGMPLGTAVEIEAVVREAYYATAPYKRISHYELEVETVNGNALSTRPRLRFENPSYSTVRLATNPALLRELARKMTSKDALETAERGGLEIAGNDPITPAEAEEFVQTYVGSRDKILVYELATIDGRPTQVPANAGGSTPLIEPFECRTKLYVIASVVSQK